MDVIWLAVIVAAVVKFAIGAVWYAPPVLGKQWQALAGMTPEQVSSGLVPAMIVQIVGDLIMAYILARIIVVYGGGFGAGVLVGVMVWLGFVATVTISQVFYERRPMILFLINNGYLLIGIVVMGAILGWWHTGAVAPVTPPA